MLADYRDFRGQCRPVQLRAVQFHPDPAQALRRRSSIFNQELGENLNFIRQAALQPAQVEEPGGAAAVVRRPRRRQRQSARHDHDRRQQPVQPVRHASRRRSVDALVNEQTYYFIGRRVIEGGPRHYFQKVDTYLRRRPRSTGSSTPATATGTGTSTASPAATRPSRRCSATSTPPISQLRAGAGRQPAPRRACRSTSSAASARSPRRCSTIVSFTQRDSIQQNMWGLSRQHLGEPVRAPGRPLGLAAGLEYRNLKGRFDPDPIVAAGPRLRHSGAADQGQL